MKMYDEEEPEASATPAAEPVAPAAEPAAPAPTAVEPVAPATPAPGRRGVLAYPGLQRGHARLGQSSVSLPVPGRIGAGVAATGIGLDRPDLPVQPRAHFGQFSGGVGRYHDAQGREVNGQSAEGSVVGLGLGVRPGQTGVGIDGSAFSGFVGRRERAGVTESGSRGSIVEGGLSAGATIGGDYQHLRIGAGVGYGRTRRFGLTDTNGDGRQELHMGFTGGPLSVDYTSETLGRAYLWGQRRLQRMLGREPQAPAARPPGVEDGAPMS